MATHSSILAWRIPMDRGAWQTIVHRVTKSWTWLTWLSTAHRYMWKIHSVGVMTTNFQKQSLCGEDLNATSGKWTENKCFHYMSGDSSPRFFIATLLLFAWRVRDDFYLQTQECLTQNSPGFMVHWDKHFVFGDFSNLRNGAEGG